MRRNAYDALRAAAAVFDLTGRGHIRVTGPDRARLLHAMTTNHVQQMKTGDTLYAFFLSAQGRILADANIISTDSALLLDTEPETAEPVFQHVDKFIIADDVTLENATSQIAVLAVEGPGASAVLSQLAIDPPEPGKWVDWRSWIVASLSASGLPGFRFFVPRTEREAVLEWIAGTGAIPAGVQEWDVVRLEQGVPRYGCDITGREIPQETGVMRAIHFSKGCYLGQEIVERVRSRGQVHRKLTQLMIAGAGPVAPHTKILSGGKEVGEITSSAASPAADITVALGYVRAETRQQDTEYTVAGRIAVPGGNQPGGGR